MPTIVSEAGFRLFFYSNEGTEPPHVHVEHQGGTAKFWLTPIRLADSRGLNAAGLAKATALARKHETLIKEKWNVYFASRK